MIYHGNGGKTNTGDEEIYYSHLLNNHLRANTMQGSKCFYQEGYVLDSWNTSEDGTGERIGLGSRITVYKDKTINLYAIWVKESDYNNFDFQLSDDMREYYLFKCKSNDERIVIPNNYLGKPVTKILSNAIENLDVKQLYINENCQEVEDGAIINCTQLKDVHMFDSLNVFSDVELNNKFNHLYINGNTNPRFSGGTYQAIFADKIDRLILGQGGKKILFIGNSNTLYSIEGEMVADYFNTNVVSMGVQEGIGIRLEMEVIRKYCKSDKNIIVFCPEFNSIYNSLNVCKEIFFAAENNWDMLTSLDFSDTTIKNVFDAYNIYKNEKQFMEELTYWETGIVLNIYGTKQFAPNDRRESDWFSSKVNINKTFYKDGKANWLNNLKNELVNSDFYFSCPSYNINAIEDKDFLFNDYQRSIGESINFPMISQFSDYGFTGEAFYNDNYHLVYEYTIIRTNKLIQDLDKFI